MTNNSKKAVLVLGMHRSGTSALMAGIHQALGVDLGPVGDCYYPENPKGFFENFEIVSLNKRILSESQGTWDSLGCGKTMDISGPVVDSFLQEAGVLVAKYYANSEIFGLKDPRVTVILPFWEKVLKKAGSQVYRIIALRSPLEVALSQQTRHRQYMESSVDYLSGGDLCYSLNLWFWYNIRMLNDIPDDNNIVVEFDNLIKDPVREMKRMSRFLRVSPHPEGLQRYQEEFLKKNLKHHTVGQAEIRPYLKEYSHIFELYRRMQHYTGKDRLSKNDARELLSGLPDDRILQSWTAPLFGYIETIKAKMLEFREQSQAFLQQKADIEKQLSGSQSQVQRLHETIAHRDQVITERDITLSQREQALADKAAALEQAIADIRQLRDVVIEKDHAVLNAQEQINQKERVLIDKTAALEQAVEDIRQLRDMVIEKNRAVLNAQEQINQKERILIDKTAALEQAVEDIRRLQKVIIEKDHAVLNAQEQINQKERVLIDKTAALEQAVADHRQLQGIVTERDQQINKFRDELYSVYMSKSWRYTLFMRRLGTLIRRILGIPHRPGPRSMIKNMYFRMPAFIRNSVFMEKMKNRFKSKEC